MIGKVVLERIKMNALTLCILLFVLVCNFLFSVGTSWTKYNYESDFAGYRCVPNETIFERFNVYGPFACGKLCHVTNQCVSYLYQPDNHMCIGCRVYGAIWTGHYDELQGSVFQLSTTCSDRWTYQNFCYMVGHDDVMFEEAQTFCETLNASLVIIEDLKENTFLQDRLRKVTAPVHWIGMTDAENEGYWKHYPSGKDMKFNDFGPAQPDDGNASNCAAIAKDHSYTWVDEPCEKKVRPLCEKKLYEVV